MKNKLPTISLIIPAHNEEVNLKRLLPSIKKQTYPNKNIEIIVVDDNSTDATYSLAKKYGAKVIKVKTRDVELNKGIGMHAARNELVYWLDADMELCSKNYFELLVKPLTDNNNIIGSFTKEFSFECKGNTESSFLRFISYDPLQCDPVYAFFSTPISKTVIKKTIEYSICKFLPTKIPPAGRTLYRRAELIKTDVGKNKSFIDLETIEIVSRAGHQLFAYVPKAKIRHYHSQSLWQLLKKRPLRNLGRSELGDQSGDYLPNVDKKHYLWFNSKSPNDAKKVILWVIYANLFIPELVRGVYKTFRYKDTAFLWQPIASISITDAVVFAFLSRPEGRKLIKNVIVSILKGN